MERALAVANAFIQRGIDHANAPTQMKLQKLMYFAHGWNLALYDEPLVDQSFHAWEYGPVIPSIYHDFKAFGTIGIDTFGSELVSQPGVLFSWKTPIISSDNTKVNALLDRIWVVYGRYSGTQLSRITHLEGSPWKVMRDKNIGVRDVIIPDDLIRDYFKGQIRNDNRA